jgi:hypothetical protein
MFAPPRDLIDKDYRNTAIDKAMDKSLLFAIANKRH